MKFVMSAKRRGGEEAVKIPWPLRSDPDSLIWKHYRQSCSNLERILDCIVFLAANPAGAKGKRGREVPTQERKGEEGGHGCESKCR